MKTLINFTGDAIWGKPDRASRGSSRLVTIVRTAAGLRVARRGERTGGVRSPFAPAGPAPGSEERL